MYLQAESGFGTNLDSALSTFFLSCHDHLIPPAIPDTGQGGGEEVEVIHLLEGDHVWPVEEDLLEDPPSPAAPVKNAGITKAEVIQLGSNR